MTEIETELRAWMQERATRVQASPTILGADYQPRTRSRRPPLAIGGGVASLAATVAVVLTLAGGTSTAFAGWSAQPTTPGPGQVQFAETNSGCNASAFPAGQVQLVDTRGPYTIIVDSSGGDNELCTRGPFFESQYSWSTSPVVTPAAGQLYLWADYPAGDNEHPYGQLIAQVGAGVTAVSLTLTDGSVVTATVQNGWAAAWWPGNANAASAQLTTSAGTQTQRFATHPCDQDNCSGGPHGGAPGGGPGGGPAGG